MTNVDQEAYALALNQAWARTGMPRLQGVRFPMTIKRKMFDKCTAIALKTKAGTPLHDREKAWLTILRMQFCNTLLEDGTWRLGLGERQPGPYE